MRKALHSHSPWPAAPLMPRSSISPSTPSPAACALSPAPSLSLAPAGGVGGPEEACPEEAEAGGLERRVSKKPPMCVPNCLTASPMCPAALERSSRCVSMLSTLCAIAFCSTATVSLRIMVAIPFSPIGFKSATLREISRTTAAQIAEGSSSGKIASPPRSSVTSAILKVKDSSALAEARWIEQLRISRSPSIILPPSRGSTFDTFSICFLL
mmetsp:Transcript_61780/g.147084  ORF Transcript_61780/g.147084 Transcript_61780/m.147084 type:complete len:212 (+) Transcript_61780:196-831(+)